MRAVPDVFCDCVWIGADQSCESPIITRHFQIHDLCSAVLTITGLGYFEVRVNGIKVTTDRFLPVASDYEPRDLTGFFYPLKDKTTQRILLSISSFSSPERRRKCSGNTIGQWMVSSVRKNCRGQGVLWKGLEDDISA